MHAALLQSAIGDNMKAVVKNESEIGDCMNETLGASDKREDYGVSSDNLNKNIHEADLTVQPLDENLKMIAVSSDILSDGKANRKRKRRKKREDEKATIIDEVQRLDQTKMEEGSIENFADGDVTEKRKKKQKRKKAKFKDEIQREVDTRSMEDLAERNVTVEKPKIKDEVQSNTQTKMDTGSIENIAGNLIIKFQNVQDEVQSMDQTKMDTGQMDNSSEGNVTGKRKKKRKSKLKITDEVQSNIDTRSAENLSQGKAAIDVPNSKDAVQSIGQTKIDTGSTENLAVGVTFKDIKNQDEGLNMDYANMDTRLTENPVVGNVTGIRKKKRKRKVKSNGGVQKERDSRSTENLAHGNANIKMPQIKDEVQSIAQTKNDTGSTENLAVGMTIRIPNVQDEVQNMDLTKIDTRPTENPAVGNVTRKRKKKRKSRVKINDEIGSNPDTRSTENLGQGNAIIERPQIKDEVQSIGLAEMDTGSKENLAGRNLSIKNPKIQDDAQSVDQIKTETVQSEDYAEANVTGKRKKKRKRKAKIKDQVQREMDTRSTETFVQANVTIEKPKMKDEVQTVVPMYPGLTENLPERNVSIMNLKIHGEAQRMDQNKMDQGASESFAGGNVTGKEKKRRKSKAKVNDEVQQEMFIRSTESLAEGNVIIDKPRIQDEGQNVEKIKVVPIGEITEGIVPGERKAKRKSKTKAKTDFKFISTSQDDFISIDKPKIQDESQNVEKVKLVPVGEIAEGIVLGERKTKRESKIKVKTGFERMSQDGSMLNLNCEWGTDSKLGGHCINKCGALPTPMESERELFHCEDQHICHPQFLCGLIEKSENGLCEVRNDIVLDKGKDYAEGRSAISIGDIRVTNEDVKDLCPQRAPTTTTTFRRKLLVLDVNGLLADIVFTAPKHCEWDIKIYGRAVFKRPFYDDFLKFCFRNFDVAIWSSRSKHIVDKVVSYLLGDLKDKLVFCWDMKHSTKTRFTTLENKHKPLVCKDLRKIWENVDPKLPWKKGDYDESNTLLLDDSPYKALLNPLHTAIFPDSYHYADKNDDSLGPGGALRVYLEGLVATEDVQKYVEQHPFGQRPITKESCSWEFYSRVLHQMSN